MHDGRLFRVTSLGLSWFYPSCHEHAAAAGQQQHYPGHTGRGGETAPQIVGQTRPVGQYLLDNRVNSCRALRSLRFQKCSLFKNVLKSTGVTSVLVLIVEANVYLCSEMGISEDLERSDIKNFRTRRQTWWWLVSVCPPPSVIFSYMINLFTIRCMYTYQLIRAKT